MAIDLDEAANAAIAIAATPPPAAEMLPRDQYDAAANAAASAFESHTETACGGIDELVTELIAVRDLLRKDARDMRTMSQRHAETMRTANHLTSMIRTAIKGNPDADRK